MEREAVDAVRPQRGRVPAGLRTLPTRAASALVSFVLLVVVLWAGWWLVIPAVAAMTALGLHEFRDMARKKGLLVDGWPMYAFGLALIVASLRFPNFVSPPPGISWREIVLLLYTGYLLVSQVIRPVERPLERVAYSLFAMLYVPFLLSYAVMLRDTPNYQLGFWALLTPLLASFAQDTGGMVFGAFFGKRKLAPHVSPNKTVEGALGGMFLSFAMVFALATALPVGEWTRGVTVADLLAFSLAVSIAAQLGDLSESIIKRSLGAKDSGNFLPGHGGLLDRADSILFALPAAFYFIAMVSPA